MSTSAYHPAYFQQPRELVIDVDDVRRHEVPLPDDSEMIEFKGRVQEWMKLDKEIKSLEAVIKEKKTAKINLTKDILLFMGEFNVEDLNTRDGRLRYKVTNAIAPLSQKKIRERLTTFLEAKFKSGKDGECQRVIEEADTIVFQRDRIEKVSLRRLK